MKPVIHSAVCWSETALGLPIEGNNANSYEDGLKNISSISRVTVSFVVPFFNVGSALRRCVNSIRNSCSSPCEIIIVDDGSSDDSVQVAEAIANECSDVILVRSQHKGVSNARNIALERLCGDYVVFCDADDEMWPGATDVLLKLFKEGVSVVVGNVKKCNSPVIKKNGTINQAEAVKSFFRSDNNRLLGTVYGKAFKRKDILDIRFDPALKIGEDALFVLQCLLRSEKIEVTSVCVYNHHNNPLGLIRSSPASTFVDALLASEKMIRAVNGCDEWIRLAAHDLWMVFMRCCMKFRDHISREMFYEHMCAIADKIGISFYIKSVDYYSVQNNRFSLGRKDVLVGSNKRQYIVEVNCRYAPFYTRPGFVNMHIHLGDYNYNGEKVRYTSLEQFLACKRGMRDSHSYKESVANNIREGLMRGDAIFCYSSKKIKHDICQVVQLIKRGAITDCCDGVFVDNAASHTREEFLSLLIECKKRNLPIFMHISSSQEQDAAERRCYSGSLVKFLDGSGCLNSLVFMVHGNYLTEEELSVIGKRHANVVICPLANYFLSERSQRPERLDLYGIQWFVGSDSHFITRQSSVSADAGYLIRKGYIHIDKLLANISTTPILLSLKWKHPMYSCHFLNFYEDGELVTSKTIIETQKKSYKVNVLGPDNGYMRTLKVNHLSDYGKVDL